MKRATRKRRVCWKERILSDWMMGLFGNEWVFGSSGEVRVELVG